MVSRLRVWLREGVWEEDLRRASWLHKLWIATVRVAVHAGLGFYQNLVGIQAAGLTMFTLFALVPLLWSGFAVAEWLGFLEELQGSIDRLKNAENVPASLRESLIRFQSLADGVSYEALGLMGTVILGYSGYALFTKTEKVFNQVWKARRRPWYGRLGGFVAVVVFVPVLVLASIVGEAFLNEGLRQNLPGLAGAYEAGIGSLPYPVLTVALTILYKMMPSARVHWRAAAIAGAVAALAMIAIHRGYTEAQLSLDRFNRIYAALAAIPLLLIYLNLMWTVVLAGVRVSFAVQYVHSLGAPRVVSPPSREVNRRLGLAVVHSAFVRQEGDGALLEVESFARDLDLPREWIELVVESLVAAHILEHEGEDGLRVVRDPASVSVWEVARAVEETGDEIQIDLPYAVDARLQDAEESVRALLADVDFTDADTRNRPGVPAAPPP